MTWVSCLGYYEMVTKYSKVIVPSDDKTHDSGLTINDHDILLPKKLCDSQLPRFWLIFYICFLYYLCLYLHFFFLSLHPFVEYMPEFVAILAPQNCQLFKESPFILFGSSRQRTTTKVKLIVKKSVLFEGNLTFYALFVQPHVCTIYSYYGI